MRSVVHLRLVGAHLRCFLKSKQPNSSGNSTEYDHCNHGQRRLRWAVLPSSTQFSSTAGTFACSLSPSVQARCVPEERRYGILSATRDDVRESGSWLMGCQTRSGLVARWQRNLHDFTIPITSFTCRIIFIIAML